MSLHEVSVLAVTWAGRITLWVLSCLIIPVAMILAELVPVPGPAGVLSHVLSTQKAGAFRPFLNACP